MEQYGGFGFGSSGFAVKKLRSDIPRQRRQYSQSSFGVRSSSFTPSSDDASKNSTDRIVGHRQKEFYLNKPAPRSSSISKSGVVTSSNKIKKENRTFRALDELHGDVGSKGGQSYSNQQINKGSDLKHSSKGTLTATNSRTTGRVKVLASKSTLDGNMGKNGDGRNMLQSGRDSSVSSDNKLKVKLTVGGVTRTIHAKSNEEAGNGDNDGSSSVKRPRSSDASRQHKKSVCQENSSSLPEKGKGLLGSQSKDSSGGKFSREGKKDSRAKATEESSSGKNTDEAHTPLSSEPVRKSNRVPKRRFLDNAFDQAQDDDEIRYLERLRASKFPSDNSVEHENDGQDVKKRKLSKVSKSKSSAEEAVKDYGVPQSLKDSRKKLKPGRGTEDTDYFEEEEPVSDADADADTESKRKKQKKVAPDSPIDVKTEPLTTRQRALQSGKGSVAASVIEFPDGLPPPPPRRQKEKLSEVEQQAKKAEAAQRRRLQVEKQAKELQEEAIRKILGLDSDRKKEEKKQKEKEEKAKAAKLQESASNTIRWIIGPTGTVVMFPEEVGLPSIFDKKPCSYPPPREKCAGPSCTNPYKYRDSKSNLPLCSLRCYKAVQGSPHPVTTC